MYTNACMYTNAMHNIKPVCQVLPSNFYEVLLYKAKVFRSFNKFQCYVFSYLKINTYNLAIFQLIMTLKQKVKKKKIYI